MKIICSLRAPQNVCVWEWVGVRVCVCVSSKTSKREPIHYFRKQYKHYGSQLSRESVLLCEKKHTMRNQAKCHIILLMPWIISGLVSKRNEVPVLTFSSEQEVNNLWVMCFNKIL
jgi:hypothetical protein